MQTLKASLKEIVLQGEQYVLIEGGYCWHPSELLRWLERNAPTDLAQPVQVVFPTPVSEGGIYPLDREWEVIGSLPLYWIEHHSALLPEHLTLPPSVTDVHSGLAGGDR
jgi:hypothetical protein